uniref:Immunoglobulin V-set domain-containing protein n=1 Tax=Seriola dumerili TaxID=41447 RepID=A0A3B4V1K8_SERDU
STFWSYICLHVLTSTVEHTGRTDGSDVTQTPILWRNKGDNATIHCNHTKGGGYFQMYWYRQLPGENMKLIVFTTPFNKDHDLGKFTSDCDNMDVIKHGPCSFFIFLLWIKGKLTFYFRDGSRGL